MATVHQMGKRVSAEQRKSAAVAKRLRTLGLRVRAVRDTQWEILISGDDSRLAVMEDALREMAARYEGGAR